MSESKKRVCFYHEDLDGYCSGAIVATHFNWEGIKLLPINYNVPFPWEEVDGDTEVWMVDYGLQPFSDMVKLNELCHELIWIDHHESAIVEFEKYIAAGGSDFSGVRQIGQAGCELTWRYCNPSINGSDPQFDGGLWVRGIPKPVYFIGRYDVWAWEDVPDALEFQMGMRQFDKLSPVEAIDIPKRREMWDTLLLNGTGNLVRHHLNLVGDIIEAGRTIVRYRTKELAQHAKGSCFETELDGHKVIAANVGYTNSQFFDSVGDDFPDAVACMTFHYRKECWNVSIYQIKGRETPNLGEIAKAHGGGGHAGAAGFQVVGHSPLPFKTPGWSQGLGGRR